MATALLVSTTEISLKVFPPLKPADSFVIHNATTAIMKQPPFRLYTPSPPQSHRTLTLPAGHKHYSYCQDGSLHATKALISVLSHLSAFNQPEKVSHSSSHRYLHLLRTHLLTCLYFESGCQREHVNIVYGIMSQGSQITRMLKWRASVI